MSAGRCGSVLVGCRWLAVSFGCCRLVAVDWSLWVSRCGLLAVGWSLWVGRCGLVAVGWLLWVGRCGLVAEGWSLWVGRYVGRSLCI